MQASGLVTRVLVCVAGLAGLALAPRVHAQSLNTYMHIDGIVGESQVRNHEGDIILTSYSQNFGTKNCSRVVALKSLDRSSPALISRAAANALIPSVIVTIAKAGETPLEFFKATLETVLIERVDVSGETGLLVEQLILKPRTIRIEYRPQNANGSLGTPIVSTIDCN
jgi:type VI secretion system secreted protein Hcp